jgi:hydroxypyruvate reductase/glycerate 2-kinase
MNAVRKHLSRVKGGRLAHAFTGRVLVSLTISDVIADRLDVIASGPTAEDPSTFADALAVLDKYALRTRVPSGVSDHLMKGAQGLIRETAKSLSSSILNFIIGNNILALIAAKSKAEQLGYQVRSLGSGIEGETDQVAAEIAEIVQGILAEGRPGRPPLCLLSGGETTVTLGKDHGLGGRNQEFVLAAIEKLGRKGMANVIVLSGGTDGEDGPTDAAGAIADDDTLYRAEELGLSPADYLGRHDVYHFFDPIGGLIKTGLTETNVMDVRVILIGS